MYITWGSRLYGKVDEVKGLFYVKTKFGHCQFIPFVPMQSFIILDESGGKFREVPIGLDTKSWLVTWGRTALLGALVIGTIVSIALWAETWRYGGIVPAVLATGATALILSGLLTLYFHKWVRYASYPRAVQLAEMAKLTPEGHVLIEMSYGNMTEEEGRKLIADLKGPRLPPPPEEPPRLPSEMRRSPID